MANISKLSNPTLEVKVRSELLVGGEQDISSFPVEVAFPAAGEDPVDADWFDATWAAGTTAVGRKNYYVALIEVGPGSDVGELDAGAYQAFVRVTTPTETPVLAGEFLIVT